LFEEYQDGHTEQTFYHSLTTPWDVLPPDQGMVKEYDKVKDSNKHQFAGNMMNYPVWRRRFIATVHSQQMLISDKALALSTALDKNVELLGNMI
jgi:hypothetical protein